MSNADASSFAERLMKSEPSSDELRRRYEEEKLALTERRLAPLQRWMGWLALPLYGWLVVGLGYRLLTTDSAQPREWIVLEAVSSFVLLAFGLWIMRVLLRGSRVTWRDDRAMEWIGGIGLCAMAFALFEIARSLEDARAALRLHGCITVLLVGGAFSLLLERIRRSKLEMRVKMLELELRVIDLAQAIAPPSPDVPTSQS
jgi:hypothetical protein